MPISRRQLRMRQALWITCIVVILTVLVVVISWLTAGTAPAKDPARSATAPVPTAVVDRPSFAPEAPVPGQGRPPLPEAAAEPSQVPIQVADLPSPPETTPADKPDPEAGTMPVSTPPPPAAPPADRKKASPPPPAPPKPVPSAQSVPASAKTSSGGFGVQVGAFGSEATAREMKSRLEKLGHRVALLPKGNLTRVVATGFSDRAAAQKALEKLRTQGAPQAQVVSLE